MLHSKRIWSIVMAESAEWLAEQLTQFTWCGCNGFRLSDYVFVNDVTGADGAQEFAASRQDGDQFIQIESLTFSWMTYEKALRVIRQVTAGEFKLERYGSVAASRLQTPERHGRCHLCA